MAKHIPEKPSAPKKKDYLKGLKDGLGEKAKTMSISDNPTRLDQTAIRRSSFEGFRRGCVLQRHDAEIRRAGDQEGA